MSSVDWAIAGSVTAGVGILSNSLSISYFISRERSTLPGKQFILLNTLDLAMCTSTGVTFVLFSVMEFENLEVIKIAAYLEQFFICFNQFLYEATGFATCILSVSRCIKLLFPFYNINRKLLIAVTASFFSYLSIREVSFLYLFHLNQQDSSHGGWVPYNNIVDPSVLGSMIGMITTVAVSNILCVALLIKKRFVLGEKRGTAHTNIEATITIIIVSVLFLFLIMTSVITAWVIHPNSVIFKLGNLAESLNSALNPLVYFLRKKAMRQHVKKMVAKLRGKRNMELPMAM